VPSISVSRPTALVLASLALAVLVVAGNRLARTGTAAAPDVVAPLEPVVEGANGVSRSSRATVVVHVVGAVRRPGLLRLREGARVADALARAGGARRSADLAAVNLAAPLVDGTQILVPARVASGRAAAGPASGGDGRGDSASGAGLLAGGGGKVSLASATAEELDALPGVGPVTAQNILDYRSEHGPFGSVDDLDAVPGIGPSRIEQLRDLVTP
jgi:competence protein ComEA